jgi:hypothetical protein
MAAHLAPSPGHDAGGGHGRCAGGWEGVTGARRRRTGSAGRLQPGLLARGRPALAGGRRAGRCRSSWPTAQDAGRGRRADSGVALHTTVRLAAGSRPIPTMPRPVPRAPPCPSGEVARAKGRPVPRAPLCPSGEVARATPRPALPEVAPGRARPLPEVAPGGARRACRGGGAV